MIKSNLVRRTVLISMSILMTSVAIGCSGGNSNTNVSISADATRESSTEASTEGTLPETLEEEETTEEAKMYTIEEVSVKSEPKEDAEELGKLDSGVEVDITGKEDGYVSIDYDGEVGWILETSVAVETKEAGVSESEVIEIIQSVESNDIIGGNETVEDNKEVANNETSKAQSSGNTKVDFNVQNSNVTTTTKPATSSNSNTSSTKPQATQPATTPQTQPATKPVEIQPVQTQPQTQPATKPVETTPVQTQPVETTTVAPTQPVKDWRDEIRAFYSNSAPVIKRTVEEMISQGSTQADIFIVADMLQDQIDMGIIDGNGNQIVGDADIVIDQSIGY